MQHLFLSPEPDLLRGASSGLTGYDLFSTELRSESCNGTRGHGCGAVAAEGGRSAVRATKSPWSRAGSAADRAGGWSLPGGARLGGSLLRPGR